MLKIKNPPYCSCTRPVWNDGGIVTSPCRSRCTRCCRAEWGSLVPPGKWSTACRWSTRCATGAPQRRCTWPRPDLHAHRKHLRRSRKCHDPKTRWLTGDGLGAADAFLGVQVAEAFQAIGVVFPGGEALPWQLPPAADAQETLAVPGFLLIGHAPCCDGLETPTKTRSCFVVFAWCCPHMWWVCAARHRRRPTFLQAQHWYAYCFSKHGTQKWPESFGMNDLVPIGCWHRWHRKQVSCQLFPLYSILRAPGSRDTGSLCDLGHFPGLWGPGIQNQSNWCCLPRPRMLLITHLLMYSIETTSASLSDCCWVRVWLLCLGIKGLTDVTQLAFDILFLPLPRWMKQPSVPDYYFLSLLPIPICLRSRALLSFCPARGTLSKPPKEASSSPVRWNKPGMMVFLQLLHLEE